MSDPIPESLRETVWTEGDALCLWVPAESWRVRLGHRVTVGVLAAGTAATILTIGVGLVFWLIWLPLLLAVWWWVTREPTSQRVATFDREGMHLVGPFSRTYPPETLTVAGPLGESCAVYVGDRKILEAEMRPEGPWTPSSLSWFVHAIGESLGASVDDRRPLEDWARWEVDALFRAESQFDALQRRNRKDHPHLFSLPARPMRTEVDHHGVKVTTERNAFGADTVVHLTQETLQCRGQEVPLDEVVRAGWFVVGGPQGSARTTLLEFRVLTQRRWVRLFSLFKDHDTIEKVAPGLTWLADQILEHAAAARKRGRRVRGEASEVPAALRAMTQKRPE